MARVPDRAPAAMQRTSDLLITASEWDAILFEDPQASPDWKVVPPYGCWQRRLPAPRAAALLPLDDGDTDPES